MSRWMIHTKKAEFDEISKKHKISPMLARIIRNRDIVTDDEIKEYLEVDVNKMHNPLLLKDMKKASDIIIEKISKGFNIRIIADYDIDGICSGYVLFKGLKRLGANVSIAIPDRIADGYGISIDIINKAAKDNIDTIITCDNGIAAIKQIEHARNLGITVIVTDHHEVPFEVIDNKRQPIKVGANATINHKQEECGYPFKHLCGAGVAYKLIEYLYKRNNIDNSEVLELLEYVAIATIGDVVLLKGENRTIVKYGLKLLNNTKNIGLKELITICDIKTRITSYHIGFVIGPCLNASGRLDTALKGLELLLTDDLRKAKELALELKQLNDSRKDMTQNGVIDATEYVEKNIPKENKVLVVYLEDCHESLAGIIAGRIREAYYKPVFVLTKTKEGIVKGSGRSIEGYNMFEELTNCKDLLLKFGGHEMAAGLSLLEENIYKFGDILNECNKLTSDELEQKTWIDLRLPLDYADVSFVNELELLEPFGKGNEKPVFAEKDVRVQGFRIIGKNQNYGKFTLLTSSNNRMDGMYFKDPIEIMNMIEQRYGREELEKALESKPNNIVLKILFYPTINEYNGNIKSQVIINEISF